MAAPTFNVDFESVLDKKEDIDDKYFISGDTIFIHSIGRPDLGGKAKEWSAMLYDTLTNKVLNLDKNLDVLPGHFMNWTEANDQLVFSKKLEKNSNFSNNQKYKIWGNNVEKLILLEQSFDLIINWLIIKEQTNSRRKRFQKPNMSHR